MHFGKQITLQTNADNSSHACVRVLSETEICLENVEDKYDAEKAMNALDNTKIGGKQVKVSPQFRDELSLSLCFPSFC